MNTFNNRALITGITGYIGSNLSRELVNAGWDVTGIIRENSDTKLIADIKDRVHLSVYDGTVDSLLRVMDDFKPIIVLHLASLFIAEHQANQITDLILSNVLFGSHLLEAMSHAGVSKLINTGTCWQHYHNEVYNPVCLYAATKEAFEKIIKFYVEVHCFQVITLELFDTYGPKDPRKKLINVFINAAINGDMLSMSPGEQELDLVFIDDVMSAYKIVSTKLLSNSERLNNKYMLATGEPKQLKSIAKIFEKVFATRLKIAWGKRPYRNREVMQTWKNGVILPDWKPKFSLEQGLTKLYELQA